MPRTPQNNTGQVDKNSRDLTDGKNVSPKEVSGRESGEGKRGIAQWVARELREYLARRSKY